MQIKILWQNNKFCGKNLMNWKGKNVLITGIAGFAGSYLAEELLNKETNVCGLVR